MRSNLLVRTAVLGCAGIPLALSAQDYVWTPAPDAPPIVISTTSASPGVERIRPADLPRVTPNKEVDTLPALLLDGIRRNGSVDDYVANAVSQVRRADLNGDGLDQRDIVLARQIALARSRASGVGQVLRYDLDGDFTVTAAELEQSSEGDPLARSESVKRQLKLYDKNGDQVISLEEAAEYGRNGRGIDDRLDELLALDPDGDGHLTAVEMRNMASGAFQLIDGDGDGAISGTEFSSVSERRSMLHWVLSNPVCPLPPPSKDAKIVAYAIDESETISPLALGGQDQVTHLVDVVIEPGEQPLYLLLTSKESMVWRMTGATGRVTQAVVRSDTPTVTEAADARAKRDRDSASGVVGLPASKVAVVNTGCWTTFSDVDSDGAKRATAQFERGFKRKPDAIFAAQSALSISLASGATVPGTPGAKPAPKGFDPEMWEEASQYWKGGLATIDPVTLVSPARVEPYLVLPGKMGIAQLLGSGEMTRRQDGAYLIAKPIKHLPPGLSGRQAVPLVLGRGVPMPPGNPRPACIYSEESGTTVGPVCIPPPVSVISKVR